MQKNIDSIRINASLIMMKNARGTKWQNSGGVQITRQELSNVELHHTIHHSSGFHIKSKSEIDDVDDKL